MVLEASLEVRQIDPVRFREFITSQGFDNEEEFGHSYTNWLGVGAISLMSSWQDETGQHRAFRMHGVPVKPLDSCPRGLPQGSCHCIETLGP